MSLPNHTLDLQDDRAIKCIGSGTNGAALLLASGRVLKILNHFTDPESLRALAIEVDALQRIQHPNVASLLDYGWIELTPDLQAFLPDSMAEHAADDGSSQSIGLVLQGYGCTLEHWSLLHRMPPPAHQAVLLAAQLLAAAHAMTQAGVGHADLKSDNVLLSAHGQAIVSDFGLVLLAPSDAPAGHSGGAPLCMTLNDLAQQQVHPAVAAPEVLGACAVGYDIVNGRATQYTGELWADISGMNAWATGNLLYEMLAGTVPLPGYPAALHGGGLQWGPLSLSSGPSTEYAWVQQVRAPAWQPSALPRLHPEHVPCELADVIHGLLHPQPVYRLSLRAAMLALQPLVAHLVQGSPTWPLSDGAVAQPLRVCTAKSDTCCCKALTPADQVPFCAQHQQHQQQLRALRTPGRGKRAGPPSPPTRRRQQPSSSQVPRYRVRIQNWLGQIAETLCAGTASVGEVLEACQEHVELPSEAAGTGPGKVWLGGFPLEVDLRAPSASSLTIADAVTRAGKHIPPLQPAGAADFAEIACDASASLFSALAIAKANPSDGMLDALALTSAGDIIPPHELPCVHLFILCSAACVARESVRALCTAPVIDQATQQGELPPEDLVYPSSPSQHELELATYAAHLQDSLDQPPEQVHAALVEWRLALNEALLSPGSSPLCWVGLATVHLRALQWTASVAYGPQGLARDASANEGDDGVADDSAVPEPDWALALWQSTTLLHSMTASMSVAAAYISFLRAASCTLQGFSAVEMGITYSGVQWLCLVLALPEFWRTVLATPQLPADFPGPATRPMLSIAEAALLGLTNLLRFDEVLVQVPISTLVDTTRAVAAHLHSVPHFLELVDNAEEDLAGASAALWALMYYIVHATHEEGAHALASDVEPHQLCMLLRACRRRPDDVLYAMHSIAKLLSTEPWQRPVTVEKVLQSVQLIMQRPEYFDHAGILSGFEQVCHAVLALPAPGNAALLQVDIVPELQACELHDLAASVQEAVTALRRQQRGGWTLTDTWLPGRATEEERQAKFSALLSRARAGPRGSRARMKARALRPARSAPSSPLPKMLPGTAGAGGRAWWDVPQEDSAASLASAGLLTSLGIPSWPVLQARSFTRRHLSMDDSDDGYLASGRLSGAPGGMSTRSISRDAYSESRSAKHRITEMEVSVSATGQVMRSVAVGPDTAADESDMDTPSPLCMDDGAAETPVQLGERLSLPNIAGVALGVCLSGMLAFSLHTLRDLGAKR